MNEEIDIIEYLRENGYDVGCEYAEVPVLGTVSCGTPDYAAHSYETEYVPKALLHDGHFFLTAHGKSMVGWGIKEGDLLEFNMQSTAESQDLVLAVISGEVTLKTFFVDPKGRHWLLPGNDEYRPISLEDNPTVSFQGVLRKSTSDRHRADYCDCIYILERAGVGTSKNREDSWREEERQLSLEDRVIKALRPLLLDVYRDESLIQEKRDFAAVYQVLVERLAPKTTYRQFVSILKHAHLPAALLPSEDSVRKVTFLGKYPNWEVLSESVSLTDRYHQLAHNFLERMDA